MLKIKFNSCKLSTIQGHLLVIVYFFNWVYCRGVEGAISTHQPCDCYRLLFSIK